MGWLNAVLCTTGGGTEAVSLSVPLLAPSFKS